MQKVRHTQNSKENSISKLCNNFMYYPIATDTTTCSEVNLNDIIPSHLMVANKSEDFPAEVGTKIRLRCGNGKVVHTTYDGYFDIECADTGFDSNTEWPTPDVCVFDGRKCNTADAPV